MFLNGLDTVRGPQLCNAGSLSFSHKVVTEVASAGISLHADRRQALFVCHADLFNYRRAPIPNHKATDNFQPPRRLMISLELPWGADKVQWKSNIYEYNSIYSNHVQSLHPAMPRLQMDCFRMVLLEGHSVLRTSASCKSAGSTQIPSAHHVLH